MPLQEEKAEKEPSRFCCRNGKPDSVKPHNKRKEQ